MKSIIRCLFVLTFLLVSDLQGSPHLILHFDINKTLIASDKLNHKTVDHVLNEILALKYHDCWDCTVHHPISFVTYVKKHLITTAENETLLTAARKDCFCKFLDYLRENNHPYYESALKDYEAASIALHASDSFVFASFYRLIEFLDENQISYTIILRSFGGELTLVQHEINTNYKMMFRRNGKFREGKLQLDNEEWIEEAHAIYKHLLSLEHTAIHDDWPYWNAHANSAKKGKLFPIDRRTKNVLSIFFDDNIINDPQTNIITAVDAHTGEHISIEELIDLGQAIPVNTLEAILNREYYVDVVLQTIQKHAIEKHAVNQ